MIDFDFLRSAHKDRICDKRCDVVLFRHIRIKRIDPKIDIKLQKLKRVNWMPLKCF